MCVTCRKQPAVIAARSAIGAERHNFPTWHRRCPRAEGDRIVAQARRPACINTATRRMASTRPLAETSSIDSRRVETLQGRKCISMHPCPPMPSDRGNRCRGLVRPPMNDATSRTGSARVIATGGAGHSAYGGSRIRKKAVPVRRISSRLSRQSVVWPAPACARRHSLRVTSTDPCAVSAGALAVTRRAGPASPSAGRRVPYGRLLQESSKSI